MNRVKLGALILILIISVILSLSIIAIALILQSYTSAQPLPYFKIYSDIRIVVVESPTKSRILYLDTSQWYCKSAVFTGGDATLPKDLWPPKSKILFFFIEDIENETMADNYGDMIIRMNPIIDPITGKYVMVVAFFTEGGYGKLVYYAPQGVTPRELYNYTYVEGHPELTNSHWVSTIDMVNDP